MTCEICLMNRHALALAADSATTVTQWVNGKPEERYFKGSNKIFDLSGQHPVGMMIFGNADLQRVPWEVLAKEYRKARGHHGRATLNDYAVNLFEYVKTHPIYSPSYREKVFLREVDKVASRYIARAGNREEVKKAVGADALKVAYKEAFDKSLGVVEKRSLPDIFTPAEVDASLQNFRTPIEVEIVRTLKAIKLEGVVDPAQVAELAVKALYKYFDTFLSSTGVVVTGYGDEEYLPSYHEYECYGFLRDTFVCTQKSTKAIDLERPQALIKPFATTAMVDTFMNGFSSDVFGNIKSELVKTLQSFAADIQKKLGVATPIADLETMITDATNAHTRAWTWAAFDAHSDPLDRVIGALPVDAMAELAETLISLEALKEKVTRPSESVSGPIDVAVITKGDGFVWVKRKHYFDPKLNPRFFLRQGVSAKAAGTAGSI